MCYIHRLQKLSNKTSIHHCCTTGDKEIVQCNFHIKLCDMQWIEWIKMLLLLKLLVTLLERRFKNRNVVCCLQWFSIYSTGCGLDFMAFYMKKRLIHKLLLHLYQYLIIKHIIVAGKINRHQWSYRNNI